jgi:very-short-patch-repair endonuclease
MTSAEKCLWQRFQLNHLGLKFYRQKPIGEYIVDFFCPKAHLVIEVDGGSHYTDIGKQNDRLRDEHMKSLELTVLRFSNSEVLNNTDKVIENVKKILLNPPFKKGDNPGSNKQRTFTIGASSSFVKGGAEADL